jgi:hypothetical protein
MGAFCVAVKTTQMQYKQRTEKMSNKFSTAGISLTLQGSSVAMGKTGTFSYWRVTFGVKSGSREQQFHCSYTVTCYLFKAQARNLFKTLNTTHLPLCLTVSHVKYVKL